MSSRHRSRSQQSRTSHVTTDSLYAYPTPPRSIRSIPSRPSSVQEQRETAIVDSDSDSLDQGTTDRVKEYVKQRSASDSAFNKNTVKRWAKSSVGKEAEQQYRNARDQEHEYAKMVIDKQAQNVRARLHPRSYSDSSLVKPVDGVRERIKESIMRDELNSYTRLPTILSIPASGAQTPNEVDLLHAQEITRSRLNGAINQLKQAEQKFEKTLQATFDEMVTKHESELRHDINELRHRVFNSYHYVLDPYGVEHLSEYTYCEKADPRILEGARQAFALDKMLLIKHYFEENVKQLRGKERTEQNLLRGLNEAHTRVLRMVCDSDDFVHKCLSDNEMSKHVTEWNCKGCEDRAYHLYEAKYNKLHEEVLKFNLYRFSERPEPPLYKELRQIQHPIGEMDPRVLNVKYWFAVFACRLVEMRVKISKEVKNADARADALRRTLATFVKFHEALEKKLDWDLHEIHNLFFDIAHHEGDPQVVPPREVVNFCQNLKRSLIDPEEKHLESKPISSSALRKTQNFLNSDSSLWNGRRPSRQNVPDQVKNKIKAWDDGNKHVKPISVPSSPPRSPERPQVPRLTTQFHAPAQLRPEEDSPSSFVQGIVNKLSWSSLRPGRPARQASNSPPAQSRLSARKDSAQSPLSPLEFAPFEVKPPNSRSNHSSPVSRSSSRSSQSSSSSSSVSSTHSRRGRPYGLRDFAYPQHSMNGTVPHAVLAYSPARRPRGRSVSVHRRPIVDDGDF